MPSGTESWTAAPLVNPACFPAFGEVLAGSVGVLGSLYISLLSPVPSSVPSSGKELTTEGWALARAGPDADPRPNRCLGACL